MSRLIATAARHSASVSSSGPPSCTLADVVLHDVEPAERLERRLHRARPPGTRRACRRPRPARNLRPPRSRRRSAGRPRRPGRRPRRSPRVRRTWTRTRSRSRRRRPALRRRARHRRRSPPSPPASRPRSRARTYNLPPGLVTRGAVRDSYHTRGQSRSTSRGEQSLEFRRSDHFAGREWRAVALHMQGTSGRREEDRRAAAVGPSSPAADLSCACWAACSA